jgi:membrane protein YqaA with SNARE-associated domain
MKNSSYFSHPFSYITSIMGNFWIQISTIYLAGITGIWKGVPVGFAMEAHPLMTALFTALGSITVVLVLLTAGEPLKQRILSRYSSVKLEKKKNRMMRIMDRYGVAGVGLIATGLIGPILSTLLGLVLISKTRKLMFYLIAGVLLWSSLLTLLVSLGLTAIAS